MGSQSNRTGVIRKGRDTESMGAQRKGYVGRSKKAPIHKPRREVSGEAKPANTVTFQYPELWEMQFCCLGHPVCRILLQQLWVANTVVITSISQVKNPKLCLLLLLESICCGIEWYRISSPTLSRVFSFSLFFGFFCSNTSCNTKVERLKCPLM